MKTHRTVPLGEFRVIKRRKKRRKEPVPPIPRAFDFGFTPERPLVPLAAAMLFLNRNSKQVLALIEEGKLRWAFDIRREGVARREVRILRQSLFEFTGLISPSVGPRLDEASEFAAVVGKILPPGVIGSPTVTSGPGLRGRVRAVRQFQIKLRITGWGGVSAVVISRGSRFCGGRRWRRVFRA